MYLVISEHLSVLWVQLIAETAEEGQALEDCAARGEWTSGRGEDAVPRLQELARRLGHPDVRVVRESAGEAEPGR